MSAPDLVALTTTAGGELHAAPDRVVAVWEISTYRPPTGGHPAFPGQPATEETEEAYGFQTRVEVGDGAGTFSVVETVAEVLERRKAAFAAVARRRGLGRFWRVARRVRA